MNNKEIKKFDVLLSNPLTKSLNSSNDFSKIKN